MLLGLCRISDVRKTIILMWMNKSQKRKEREKSEISKGDKYIHL